MQSGHVVNQWPKAANARRTRSRQPAATLPAIRYLDLDGPGSIRASQTLRRAVPRIRLNTIIATRRPAVRFVVPSGAKGRITNKRTRGARTSPQADAGTVETFTARPNRSMSSPSRRLSKMAASDGPQTMINQNGSPIALSGERAAGMKKIQANPAREITKVSARNCKSIMKMTPSA